MSEEFQVRLDRDQMSQLGAGKDFLNTERLIVPDPYKKNPEAYLINPMSMHLILSDGGYVVYVLHFASKEIEVNLSDRHDLYLENHETHDFYKVKFANFLWHKLKIQNRIIIDIPEANLSIYKPFMFGSNLKFYLEHYGSLNSSELKDTEYKMKLLKYRLKYDF